MKEKEEIKRIDGKYFLIRELETNGEPVNISGGMVQLIKSIDDDDCHHCYMYDTYNCGEPCVGGFFVRVLPENGEEKGEENHCTGKDLEPKEKTMVEWKIGEIKQIDGEWYQCLKDESCICLGYDFFYNCDSNNIRLQYGSCQSNQRKDNKSVIFKKLEKFGGCYGNNGKIYQLYKLHMGVEQPVPHPEEVIFVKPDVVQIEIKQTKEDMGKEKHPNPENILKKLKPFDLEAAKAGKPVCTRGGRKARIICFDLKGAKYPIVAAIKPHNCDTESLSSYDEKGKYNHEYESSNDLMMLPVKKEGWVNVYNNPITHNIYTSADVFESKEIAEEQDTQINRIATCKITWEE